MKTTPLLLFFLTSLLWAQGEPQIHLQSIQARSAADSAFLSYTLQHTLAHPGDRQFIANRDLLRSLCVSVCSQDSVIIHDSLADGTPLYLALYASAFDPSAHRYQYFPGPDSLLRSIDSLPAYGAVEALPSQRLDSLVIRLDGRPLVIPAEAYRCFYQPNFCQLGLFQQPVAAYPSLDGRYLYLYLYGGQGAGTYFAKLAFDRERYLTHLITEYAALRQHQAFRIDFLGY
jgi:hypothetical protein